MKKVLSWFTRLNTRLKKTGDPEPEQAEIRLVIGLLLMLYFFVPWSSDQVDIDIFASTVNIIIALGSFVACSIFVAILLNPAPSPTRRVLGIFSDTISLSSLLYLTGGDYLTLFVFYLWVSLGNGFRYGANYLYISCGAGLVGFSSVVYWGEYWQENQSIAISLIVILCVLPLYAGILLTKLHKAIASAKYANEAKSRFLANMSHELRTPLNGVIGMGELLRETSLSVEQRGLVNTLHSSANTLLEQIENVLDIAKIEAGKIIIEDTLLDLHTLANSVIYMLSPMGKSRGISVSCTIDPDTPFSLKGDQQHIRQVLINLVSNAIKFTDEGSVQLRVYKSGGTYSKPLIRFEIIDTGIGIGAEFLDNVFDDFTQAEKQSSRSLSGTGLGTTISKELVELMNGKIGVNSELGSGSVFWFEISMEAIKHDEPTLSHNRLLLLASEDTALTIRPSLKSWDIDFNWVRSSTRAFSQLLQSAEEGNSYRIVIVDQAATGSISAVQFAQMLKSEKSLQNTSLILVNSSDSMINMNNIDHYYISTILNPEDKRTLFNAIHAAQSVYATDSKVITLAEHYSKQIGSKVLNILVAEDNLVNQQVIHGILKHAGHKVKLVDTGEKALDALSEKLSQIDMVVLDMNMPEKSGIDVVRALRFMDPSHSMPVIMLTADATPEAKEAGLNAGANVFLTKPVDAKILLGKIAALSINIKEKSIKSSEFDDGKLLSDFSSATPLIIDESSFFSLFSLGDDDQFIHTLVANFDKDGTRHVECMKAAVVDDYLEYREALHALKGSATELGATHLVNICIKGEVLKPYDLGSKEINAIAIEIDTVFKKTIQTLLESIASHQSLPREDQNNHPGKK